ncbi:MAG TPA: YfiR family protein [Bacteroidales bacterium]|nr:YfiR family protein [Bacteroidales bacterium]
MKKISTLLIAILITTSAYMQTSIPKAQSLFIYNFSRMIEWPASYRTGNFIIGILGTSEVAGELESYTKGKKVGAQDIQVIRYKTPQEIQQCHILFVPFVRTKQLPEVVSLLAGKSTLIITEKTGALTEGSAINFVILEDKMKFELKAENANKFGIKFSAKLQEMSGSQAMM